MAEYYNPIHIAKDLREYVKKESRRLRLSGVRARLVVLSVNASPVLSCLRAMSWADITINIKQISGNHESMKAEVMRYSAEPDADGIIVCDTHNECDFLQDLCDLIPAKKDILCTGAEGIAYFLRNKKNAFMPCTSDACLRMLSYAGADPKAKNVAIVGQGREQTYLAYALMNAGANVAVCHPLSEKTPIFSTAADIIISWTGEPHSLTARYVNDSQMIVDMGMNTSKTGEICVEVDIDSVEPYVSGFILGAGNDFRELCDYIAAEHVLRSAESRLDNNNTSP